MKSSILALSDFYFGLYIYISTDSVYEVTQAKYVEKEVRSDSSYCTNDSFSSYSSYESSSSSDSIEYTIERRDSADLTSNFDYYDSNGCILESYAYHDKRSRRFRDYLLKRDAYGFEKLTCENILLRNWGNESEDQRPFIIFRLPDVIGPYDDSARLWVIILKMMLQSKFNKLKQSDIADKFMFQFDSEEQKDMMSLVSADDVANASICLFDALKYNKDEVKKILNTEYNLTSDGNVSLKELHEAIFDHMNSSKLKFSDVWKADEKSSNTYPSVHWGPISNKKVIEAMKPIGFKPIPIKESIIKSVDYYTSITKLGDLNQSRLPLISPHYDHFGKLIPLAVSG